MRRVLQEWPPLRGLVPLLAFLLAWQFGASEQSPNFPPPSTWWPATLGLASRGLLGPAILATLRSFCIGLALATLIGFALGLLIGTVAVARRWSGMLLEYLRALPPPVM